MLLFNLFDFRYHNLLPAVIMYIKVVTTDGSLRSANPDLNLNDYEQVRIKFEAADTNCITFHFVF